MTLAAAAKKNPVFNPNAFLGTVSQEQKAVLFAKKQAIFAQGEVADAVFYVQEGKVRLTVVSHMGREATVGTLSDGDFCGEGCLAGQALRMGSAIAMTECSVLRIDKKAMMEALHREHKLSDLFVAYLWRETSVTKKIWWINCSIPAKKGWLEFFCCWLTLARRASLKL